MAPGWRARQRKRQTAARPDPAAEAIMLLLSLGWQPSGMTSPEARKYGDKVVQFGQRRRFVLPHTPHICTVGGRSTCFYTMDGNLQPIDFMTVPTNDLCRINLVALHKFGSDHHGNDRLAEG